MKTLKDMAEATAFVAVLFGVPALWLAAWLGVGYWVLGAHWYGVAAIPAVILGMGALLGAMTDTIEEMHDEEGPYEYEKNRM